MNQADATTQGYRESGGRPHQCNCIGCCTRCGTCRTAPWHTHEYCELVQRQEKERVDLVLRQRAEALTPGLEYGTY